MGMTTNVELLAVALRETIACQDPGSPEFVGRSNSPYAPFGPFLSPGPGGGQCATTDLAMDAIARLADSVRDCDPTLRRAMARGSVRREALNAFSELWPALASETEGRARWRRLRSRLLERLAGLGVDLMHYIPVWLFVGQDCDPVEVGPVRFVRREDWPGEIARRRGSPPPAWLDNVRAIWADDRERARGRADPEGDRRASGCEIADAARQRRGDETAEEQQARHSAERVARGAHPDQWVACVEVVGFEADESRRRALLATRVALDTVRLLIPNAHRDRLWTSADHAAPWAVDRFRQLPGGELRMGSSVDRPGVSGGNGLATEIITDGAAVLLAAGECIRQACEAVAPDESRLPLLSGRWFEAVHWFGRACTADVDYLAVIMAAISLDVLSGGGEKWGIAELLSKLTGHGRKDPVLADGTTLEGLVERVYGLRSKIAHGSFLALHEENDLERVQLQDLAAAALRAYSLALGPHAAAGGPDNENPIKAGLTGVAPATH